MSRAEPEKSLFQREVRALEREAAAGEGGANTASRAALARSRLDLAKAVSKLDCAKDIANRLRELERKAGGKQGEAMQVCSCVAKIAKFKVVYARSREDYQEFKDFKRMPHMD